ncbi:TrmH family RNA methyltransferase [Nitrospira sp. Kam-Ns4a]
MPTFASLPAGRAAAIRDLLRDRTAREAEDAFVLESPKPILELLDERAHSLLSIVVTPEFLDRSEPGVRARLEQAAPQVFLCRSHVYRKLSDLAAGPGLLAVVRKPHWEDARIFARSRLLGLYGESLQDPANVGAIIRTALAFELDALWLSPDSADPFGPKVVRATAGAVLRLPIFEAAGPSLFTTQACTLLASVPAGKGDRSLRDLTDLPARTVLALGNESRGLSPAALEAAAVRFTIPVSSQVDSLNVAAAAAIALFHFSGLR